MSIVHTSVNGNNNDCSLS